MIKPPFPKVYVPLLLILAVEILFRLGLWENLTAPNSHTGLSVQVRQAILQQAKMINFVTIGNSIPESGLDHQKIYALSKKYGFTHTNLCMPGSHLMTIRKLTQWLPRHVPNLYGVVIGLSFRDLFFSFNGYYEIKVITPFITVGDEYWIAKQIPVQLNKLESYGIFSNLIASREDISNFLSNPIKRCYDIAGKEKKPLTILTKSVLNNDGSICSIDLSSYNNCLDSINLIRLKQKFSSNLSTVESQCIKFRDQHADELNIEDALREPLPQERLLVKKNWQLALKQAKFKLPPIFILMPTIMISSSARDDQTKYKWALDILKSLDKSGDIILEDLTLLLHSSNECEYFEDLVHLNKKGQDKVMETIKPHLNTYYKQMREKLNARN